MERPVKERGRRGSPAIKEEFPKGWLYKLLYWHEAYGPIENENPYVRMRKKYFWYVLMGKLKGKNAYDSVFKLRQKGTRSYEHE